MPTVRVRLVLKTREGGLPATNLTLAHATTPFERESDPRRVREALSKSGALGINEAVPTLKNRVDGVVSAESFRGIFGCDLTQTPVGRPATAGLYSAAAVGGVLLPDGELKIPESLRDEVAFAYVPTPPSYFALQFAPPSASVYHLRLEDMARAVRAYRCHRMGWTGRRIKIAMADTGFSPHLYFDDYGFEIRRVHTPLTADPGVDNVGHGTAESANALVIAPDCSFIGVKHDDFAAQALETCLAEDPDIMTNSWGWDIDNQTHDELKAANPNQYLELKDVSNIIADGIASGVTVIFSAGNSQRPFPACMPELIAAGGATVDADRSLKASSYASSYVSKLYPGRRLPDLCGVVGELGVNPMKGHLMLPVPNGSTLEGENLPVAGRNRGWSIFSGTSAAAPQLAGVVALMLSVNPKLRPAEVKSILMATATDVTVGDTAHGETAIVGPDLATGSGLVDAFSACLRVQQMLQQP